MCPYKYNPLLSGKLDLQTVNLNDLEDVNTAGTVDGKVLSYQAGTWVSRGTVVTEQIPNLPTSKTTSGTFNANRIPVLPTDRYGSAVLVSGERTLTANLNFGSHEALNMQLEQLGTHPAAARGRIYYNTTDDKIYVHIGTA